MKALVPIAAAIGLGVVGWQKNWPGIGRIKAWWETKQAAQMPTTQSQLAQAQAALWNWYIATPTHGTAALPWPGAISDPQLTAPAWSSPSAYSGMTNYQLLLDAFQIANNNANGFTGYQDGVLDSATFALLVPSGAPASASNAIASAGL